MHTFSIRTAGRTDFVDITREVANAVTALGIDDGVVTIFVPHTTAGVTINENADPDVTADMELVRVWELWEAAVGQAIAANTRPAAFRGKLLVVEVTSSTWLQELQFLKSDLITQVNAALGKPLIGDIRFKIGSV